MEWQPIETAPKDEHVLIACIGECSTQWMYVAVNRGSRWRIIERKDASSIWVYDTPTHWMPLPDPPRAAWRTNVAAD